MYYTLDYTNIIVTYCKISKISPGAYIFQRAFLRGLSSEGNLSFKIDWASLMVGSKFTLFALFFFVFEDNFPSKSPRGAYIWRGLYTEGLIFGILRYFLSNIISKTTRSVSSDIQTTRSWLKKETQPSFLRPTSGYLDIGWNTEWSFGYSFSNEQSFLEKFKDKVPQNFMVISIRYPNRAHGMIFFVFSLWIINEFGNITSQTHFKLFIKW